MKHAVKVSAYFFVSLYNFEYYFDKCFFIQRLGVNIVLTLMHGFSRYNTKAKGCRNKTEKWLIKSVIQ